MSKDVLSTQRSPLGRALSRALKGSAAAGAAFVLSGCLLTSPYWNQEFEDHTKPISLQAFTTDKATKVKFSCAKAHHGGLYPSGGTAVWVHIADVQPQSQALLDSQGGKVYGAGMSTALPAACWRLDPANSIWYAAVRARQEKNVMDTGQKFFYTFTNDGLECVGRENGEAASWFGWFNKGCETAVHYTIFRATS
jgi:hypothetical protein